MTNWKKLAAELVKTLETSGLAIILLEDSLLEATSYVDMTPEGKGLKVAGKGLTAKKVREWCWNNRHCRAFQRPRAFFWAVYDNEQNATFVGVGALTTRRAAERMKRESLEFDHGQAISK